MPFSEIAPSSSDDSEYIIPAHISTYLETNDMLHDAHVAEITRILWDIDQWLSLAKADEEASARNAVHSSIHSLSILSPLRRFPAEILFEIFQHTIEQRGYSVPETSIGPWSLSRVSRHWRATALTYSGALWSNLYVGIYAHTVRVKNPLLLLRTCLVRSRGYNISVNFNYSDRVPTHEDKIHNLLDQVRGRIPNLKNLVLRSEPVRAPPLIGFKFAPQLRTAKIHDGPGVVLGPDNPSLISYEDYRLHVSISQSSGRAENSPIILPQLKNFRGSHRELIQNVTTPNLETFHLDMFFPMRSFYDDELVHVRDLFVRSECWALSELVLTNAIRSHILDILPLLPILNVLQFHMSNWRDQAVEEDIFRRMFQQMTNVNDVGTSYIVPNLREFSFEITERRHSRVLCLDGIFLDMVASRAQTLKKVKAEGTVPNGIWTLIQVSVFEGLLKGGMDISLNGLRPWDFRGRRGLSHK
ncbi:hypothetical protein EDD18DRAFT_1334393 [Armillaria luteobubalina]|uniref:F-box domain-containing protein n=1 Tax=Armillaria luteobubalina TaxID=153913 RepID=A0AA39PYC1_9AGAR|nr:hypothetical protein EDD18DRAFT_1334393 [Armillaria luteobubalina]